MRIPGRGGIPEINTLNCTVARRARCEYYFETDKSFPNEIRGTVVKITTDGYSYRIPPLRRTCYECADMFFSKIQTRAHERFNLRCDGRRGGINAVFPPFLHARSFARHGKHDFTTMNRRYFKARLFLSPPELHVWPKNNDYGGIRRTLHRSRCRRSEFNGAAQSEHFRVTRPVDPSSIFQHDIYIYIYF